ncbi:hypothetical protein ACFQ3L_06855 [Lacticaseibacillus jixianensis]|uniref:Uncharacterized protein n=1 Tax=Lacticaseibacillus jixianensis TaxID=2486012 RepID=A0ABW4B8R5_9LACO|nr:hypothetical protein [Lacticaseibacillus jixianensis]
MIQTFVALADAMAAARPVITITDPVVIGLIFSFSDAWQTPATVGGGQTPAMHEASFAAQLYRLLYHASPGLALHMQPRFYLNGAYFGASVASTQQFFLAASQYEFILAGPNLLTLTRSDYRS